MSTPPTLLANLTAGVDELKIEADHHTAAVTPEVLVEEVIEHHHANQLRPEQDEGELIELPTQINVTDADSLTSEVSRLIPILSSVGGSPWSVRVAALKRISDLCRSPASNTVENFPHQMSRLKECLVEQLTDRRSLVVKQACETIVYLSAQFTAAYLDPSSSSSSASISSDNLSHARDIWIELTKYFIDFLLPIIPITVQVINSSACLCLNHLAKNIAPLYREGKYDYPILGHLILFGASHKHGIVRDHSFRAISNSIIRLDSKYVQHEQALDEMVEEKIQLAAMNKKRKAAAEANGEEFEFTDDENETKSSSSPTPSSTLFSSLETVIGSGVFDSFDKTRAAARIALIQFEKISPSRAQRIIESMSPTQQNSYTRQKDEYLINQAVKASANKNAPSSSSLTNTLSDDELEAELNAPKKSSAPSAVNTSANGKKATTTSSTSSVPSKGKFSGKKKALKKKKNKSSAVGGVDNGDDENDEDEIVVVEKSQPKSIVSEAEASERAKEANAAAVLAAANKESHDDDDETENDGDEADTESTPITESKQNRPATSDVDEDDSSHGDGVRDSDAGTNKSAPSLYDRNFTLLAKLLDLERPMLTDKMIDFLLHEGVLDVFLSFIVRVRADEIPIESLAKVKSFHDFGAQYHNIFDSNSESSSEVDQTDAPREDYTNLPLTHRHRPQTDNDDEAHAVRRSYFVMQILCAQRQSNSLLAVLTPKVSQMVLRLMCVFHPKSVGNFYHAMAVLQQLLTTFPGTVLTALCSPSGRSLLSLMFDHLHEAPVIPAITAMLNASVNNKVMGASQPSDIIHHLNQMDILHTKLIPRIINYPTQSRVVSQASADFLLQYIQLLQSASTEKAASSMKRLLDDIGMKGKAIDLLVSGLLDSPSIGRPLWQQTNIGTILHTLVTSSAPTMITITETDVNAQALAQMTGNTAALQKKVPNQLFPLKSLIQRMISAKLGPLCQMLTAGEKLPRDTPGFTPDMDETLTLASSSSSSSNVATLPSSLLAPHPVHFSSYTVASSFSSARLQLLKLIVQLVDNDLQDALRTNGSLKPLFTQIPHHTWLVLIDWFFRYRHNNFYLAQFRTLILGMVKFSLESAKYREELKKSDPTNVALSSPCPSEATLKFLFVEAKLLIRMIAFYAAQLDEPSCAGSYVLELCNHFRFSSELMPHSAFLWTYITSCQQWVQFQSTLKDESRKQSYNLHRKPYVEDPLTEQRRQLERALGFSLGGDGPPQNPDAFKIPIGYTEGIELGSVFAWHMGYTEKTSSVSEKGKKKKKKKGKKKKKSKKGDADSTNTSLDDSTTSTNNSGDDGDSDGDDSGIESDASSSSSHSSASSPAKLKKSNPTIQIHSPTNQTTPPPSTNDLQSSADSSSFTSSPTVDVNMKSLESPTNLLAQLTPSPPISPMLNQQANKNQIV